MFVFIWTYNSLKRKAKGRIDQLKQKLVEADHCYDAAIRRAAMYSLEVGRLKREVAILKAKDKWQPSEKPKPNTAGKGQFTQDELRSLLQLVHPDKHNGKESAMRLTQKINDLRA
ncbi:hypothetical protein D3C80_803760 [compost metagenome]